MKYVSVAMAKKNIIRAYEILDSYNGQNPYVWNLARQYKRGGKVLSEFEVDYIINNHDYVITEPHKTVNITNELGERLQEKYNLDFAPKKIRIEKVIGEMGDSLHCYVKYRQSVPQMLMFVSRKGILDSVEKIEWQNYEVDLTPFEEKLAEKGIVLKQHQRDGVRFLCANKRAILADGMGMGKTLTSTVAALATGEERILVITTASLKTTWKRECMNLMPESDIAVVSGSDWKCGKRVTIVNYDVIQNFYEVAYEPVYETVEIKDIDGNVVDKLEKPVFVKNSSGKEVQKMRKSRNKEDIKAALEKSPLFLEKYGVVIIDEVHKLSNNKAKRYKVISDFLNKANPKYITLLTGTPLSNKPEGFYHVLNLLQSPISRQVTNDWKYFMNRYCGAKQINRKDGRTVLVVGKEPMHLDELREKVKNCYIRRLASESNDMVNKTVETVYYELTPEQRREYNRLWDEYLRASEEGESSVDLNCTDFNSLWDEYEDTSDKEKYRILIEGGLLRQYLANQMVEHTIEFANSLIEDGNKVVIITSYKKELEAFKAYYGEKCVVHHGGLTNKKKDFAQSEFLNNPKCMVFVGNVISASVGISLQSSHNLIFNSFSFNSSDNLQAEDRIYRLSQQHDCVVFYMLFEKTYSEEMYTKVLAKEQMANTLIKSEKEKGLK